jgi:hypothetical protein
MKTKIRKSIFETNSSSTHSIVIGKYKNDTPIAKGTKVTFVYGDFGWEVATYDETDEKASYLYSAAIDLDMKDCIEKAFDILLKNGIGVEVSNEGNRNFGIDHPEELTEFVKTVCENEEILMAYLFSSASSVATGNDNGSNGIEIGDNNIPDIELCWFDKNN